MEAVGWIARMGDRVLARGPEGAPEALPAAQLADEEAMARVAAGDAQALAVLFDRYKSRLFGFLYRLLGDRGVAEDLLGETFLKVYQHRDQFRRGRGFAPWVYRIARNLAIQEMRHRAVAARAAERLEKEALAEPTASVEEEVARAELRAAVIEALEQLPEDQRSAAILREYQGLDYREIAAVLGCTEQAARARTYRARLALRAALAGRLGESTS